MITRETHDCTLNGWSLNEETGEVIAFVQPLLTSVRQRNRTLEITLNGEFAELIAAQQIKPGSALQLTITTRQQHTPNQPK